MTGGLLLSLTMKHARLAVILLGAWAAILGGPGGCTQSRVEQLRARSTRVESALRKEQQRVLTSISDGTRQGRLDRLSELRLTLSAANIGLATVPVVVPLEKRDIAYNVLEEAYGTIEWNIPLGPGERPKALPVQFQDGVLRLD